jgi:hypothetical protein
MAMRVAGNKNRAMARVVTAIAMAMRMAGK